MSFVLSFEKFQVGDYHLVIRLGQVQDFYKSHLELLAQLSPTTKQVDKVDYQKFIESQGMNDNSGVFIYVIEDLLTHRLVASGTLLVEKKIIHQMGLVGHVEDVVVDEKYRGLKLGVKIIDRLVEKANDLSCYKVILNCYERNAGFYVKCGFAMSGLEMRQDMLEPF